MLWSGGPGSKTIKGGGEKQRDNAAIPLFSPLLSMFPHFLHNSTKSPVFGWNKINQRRKADDCTWTRQLTFYFDIFFPRDDSIAQRFFLCLLIIMLPAGGGAHCKTFVGNCDRLCTHKSIYNVVQQPSFHIFYFSTAFMFFVGVYLDTAYFRPPKNFSPFRLWSFIFRHF